MLKLISFILLLSQLCLAQMILVNPRRAAVINPPTGGGSYNSMAQTYFNYGGFTLADSQKTNISEFCDCLDDTLNAGARNKTMSQLGFDTFWLIANEDSVAGKTNFVTGSLLTKVGASWSQWSGFTTNGSSTYLNTNWRPSTGTNFIQNSASIGFGRYIIGGDSIGDAGTYSGSDSCFINPVYGTGGSRFAINDNTFDISGSQIYKRGHFIMRRTASNTKVFNKNFNANVSVTRTSIPRPFAKFLIGAMYTGGAPTFFDDGTWRYFYSGKGFTDAEKRGIINCIEKKYLDGIGKGLIP